MKIENKSVAVPVRGVGFVNILDNGDFEVNQVAVPVKGVGCIGHFDKLKGYLSLMYSIITLF